MPPVNQKIVVDVQSGDGEPEEAVLSFDYDTDTLNVTMKVGNTRITAPFGPLQLAYSNMVRVEQERQRADAERRSQEQAAKRAAQAPQ